MRWDRARVESVLGGGPHFRLTLSLISPYRKRPLSQLPVGPLPPLFPLPVGPLHRLFPLPVGPFHSLFPLPVGPLHPPPPFPLPLEPFAPFPRFRSVSSLPPPTISGRAFPVPTRVTQRQAELLQQPPISGHRFQHRIDDNRVPRRFVRQDVRISTRTRLEELRRRGRGSAGARPGAGRSSEGRT